MPYIKAAEYRRLVAAAEKNADSDKTAEGSSTSHAAGPDPFKELRAAVKANAVTVDQNSLMAAVMECKPVLHARHNGQQGLVTTDGELLCVDQSMLDRILRETKIDEVQWGEVFDCNHIAAMFVSRLRNLGLNSAGRFFSWDGGHCFNVVVIADGDKAQFRFIEAQTDRYVDSEMGDGMYQFQNALIVLG